MWSHPAFRKDTQGSDPPIGRNCYLLVFHVPLQGVFSCQVLLLFPPEAAAVQRQPQPGPLLLCTALQGKEQRDLTLSLMFKGALKSQRISEQEMQPLNAGERTKAENSACTET